MVTKPITIDMIKYLAHRLAANTMSWDEPIPDFETRYPNILESSIAAPFQRFIGKDLYKGLIGKGAVLFYLMIKNHPFQNGNKRIAVATLLIYLFINKKWIKVDTKELYNFAVWVAKSPPGLKDPVVAAVMQFIKKHIVDSPVK